MNSADPSQLHMCTAYHNVLSQNWQGLVELISSTLSRIATSAIRDILHYHSVLVLLHLCYKHAAHKIDNAIPVAQVICNGARTIMQSLGSAQD